MYRRLPVWVQWGLPFGVAALVVVALIAFVNHQTNDVPQIAKVTNKNAIVEQNREDTIIVRHQQRPHVARLRGGETASVGVRAAVVSYMNSQIRHGAMAGPVRSASCRSVSGGTRARRLLRCDVTAADVTYPFVAVVSASMGGSGSAGVATYCQRVAPPVPSMDIPVSKRCT